MKYLGLILVVALVVGQVLAHRINENDRRSELLIAKRGLSDSFRNFLENFKITMREGDATRGIPRLDPFKQDFYATNVNEKFMKGDVSLRDFEILGTSQYKVRTAEVSVFYRTLSIGLTWPRLHSIGDYRVNASLFGDKSVYGEGEYDMTVTNLSVDTVVWLGIWGGVSIKSMETKLSIGEFALSMTGLYNNEESSALISKSISDMVPQLVRDYQQEITALLNKHIMAYANEKLNGMSISELWSLFG